MKQREEYARRLPLFPLPVVLFPGAEMPLHVFEPRYRRMVATCLEGDRRFVLLYHDPDRHGPYIAEEGQVGTIARIEEFQPLPDGRSLILAHGEDRVQVRDGIESGAPYYEVLVEPFPDVGKDPETLHSLRRDTVRVYEQALACLANRPVPAAGMDQAADVSYQLACAVRIDPAWQQDLLALPTERARLDKVSRLMRRIIGASEQPTTE